MPVIFMRMSDLDHRVLISQHHMVILSRSNSLRNLVVNYTPIRKYVYGACEHGLGVHEFVTINFRVQQKGWRAVESWKYCNKRSSLRTISLVGLKSAAVVDAAKSYVAVPQRAVQMSLS